MAKASLCPPGSDNTFGPRVNSSCRAFDFTLLFEDAFFSVLPTSLFLIVVLPRLQFLRSAPVKLASYRLAVWKLSLLVILFALQVVFTALQTTTSAIHTKLSLASGLLDIIATFSAAVLSFAEDQRTVRPSDVLVIYFSAASILYIPRLRTLWLIPCITACKSLWTAIYVFTLAILIVESARKTKFLRRLHQNVTPEQSGGFWSQSLFIWVLPFFHQGYLKHLQLSEIPEVDESLAGYTAGQKLQTAWDITTADRRLLFATFRAYRWSFLSGIPPRLALTAFTFAQPFLITTLVDWMGATAAPANYGPALIGAVVLVYSGLAVSTAIYWRQRYRFITAIRAGLVSIIYAATTGSKSVQAKDMAAITLMDTDVERIASDFRFVHEIWASALEVGIALWLLELQVSVACLVPAVICLASVLATVPVSQKSGNAQRQWIERIQKRLAVTSYMLGDMKAVKILGLTDVMFVVISRLREIEIKSSERFRKLFIWQISLSNIPTDFAPFATLTTYAIISVVKKDDSLNMAQAFTSLSLISLLTSPLLTFCQALPSIVQTLACFGRIQEYVFDKLTPSPDPELSMTTSAEGVSREAMELQEYDQSTASDLHLVSFNNADISWSPETQVVLNDLNLNIPEGITMLIGPVGSGKSTILESILGQTTLKRGSLNSKMTKVAYCGQTPWIIDGTIQQNITGGTEFENSWYRFVISACGLEADMKAIPKGDMCRTGSKGVSLSSGQKQRVSLARAVYSKNRVLVLDDVFSGLDSKTISVISSHLFSREGYIKTTGRSVILATHTQQILSYADNIIVLDDGRIVDQGPYAEILSRRPDTVARSFMPVQNTPIASPVKECLTGEKADEFQVLISSDVDSIHSDATTQKRGAWSVYMYYYRSAGFVPVILLVFFSGIEAFGSNFATIWLQWWMEANEQQPNKELGKYLGVYAFLFGLSFLGVVAGCWIFLVNIISNTGLNLHRQLLQTTLESPFSFIHKTSTGSITNRFSQDMQLVDMELPMNGAQFVTSAFSCVATLIILCVIGKYLAASVPFVLGILFFVQRYYLRTSSQVRVVDIEAKAPLYAHFIETIQGLSTIHAFKWESRFRDQGQSYLNESQKPFYMLFCIHIWLQLVLNMIVGAITVIIVATMTSMRDRFAAGSIGVALNMVLTLNQSLAQMIRSWTMLETSIGAVSRVRDFVTGTPSELRSLTTPSRVEPEWPSHGAIEFAGVTVSYNPTSTPVLQNLSLKIRAGEKVAICGPSGSGKTSLILALLQLIDIQQGRIIIDDVDLSTVSRNTLRARLNTVPSDPFFMPGTLRFNLDPHRNATDESIESALKKVGLWKRISNEGGLDTELSASDWSIGERQLLTLARALNVRSSILILDEATSSVDWKTESIMQDVIDTEFASSQTIISILHRFRHIDRFDRVALLQGGKIVEYDSPQVLLARNSEFRKLYMSLQEH